MGDYAPELKIQQELLKRALEAAHTATACVEDVYTPVANSLGKGKASIEDVQAALDDWLTVWQEVRNLSDSYLKRNREHFEVRPNEELSPILVRFEEKLVEIYQAEGVEPADMVGNARGAFDGLAQELAGFEDWARKAGPKVGVNVTEYAAVATNRAKRFWQPNVRAIEKMMQDI